MIREAFPVRPILALLRRLRRDRGGNVLWIMGLTIVPLVFATGFGIDYGRAEQAQTKLNAIADSAALLALSPNLLGKPNAQSVATTYFTGQVANIANVTLTSVPTITVTAAVTSGTTTTPYSATVSYTAASKNLFSTILGKATLPIGGTSRAAASPSSAMNFYIVLDTSPSMLLPTTSTGITNLTAGALWNGETLYYPPYTNGCDFACHSNNMQQWNSGTYVVDANKYAIYTNNGSGPAFFRVACNGNVYDTNNNLIGTGGNLNSNTACSSPYAYPYGYYGPAANPVTLSFTPTGSSGITSPKSVNFPDTWWLARNYATVNPGQSQITLRTDAEGTAAAGVIQYAYNMLPPQYQASGTAAYYQMQFFTFNLGAPAPLSPSLFGTMNDVKNLYGQSFPDMGAQAPLLLGSGYLTTGQYTGSNADTDFNAMLSGMQAVLPTTAGTGTTTSPNSVLLIITDGLSDNSTDGVTQLTANNIAQCTAIKKTTRIAILYTQYIPATINYTANSSFNAIAANNVPNIQAQLQACATQNSDGTYLMQTVSTDGDIGTALNTLFAQTVQTAHLIQ